jgi:putative SOS response-associated peptidase YedK
MLAILRPADYERWLGSEPGPHDLLIRFPANAMKMWPISKQ